jgi:RimJ/RimL family protein N-acetyltransferase
MTLSAALIRGGIRGRRDRRASDDWLAVAGLYSDWPRARAVSAASWLVQRAQGRGVGTEMRQAALHFVEHARDGATIRALEYRLRREV